MYGIQIVVNGIPRNKKVDILLHNIECSNNMIENLRKINSLLKLKN